MTCAETELFPIEALREFSTRVFLHLGCPKEDAEQATDVLACADLRGIDSHGIARLHSYFEMLTEGGLNPKPKVEVVRSTPSTASVDGDNGLGLVVGAKANCIAMDLAEKSGSGWVSVRNTNHFGIAAYYVLKALERDLIGWAMTNSTALVAPLWGAERMLGTNPIAIAFPAKEEPPIVIDMATSAVAFGKVEIARRKGIPIPSGWAINGDGVVTTQPEKMIQGGALLPLGSDREHGGHKGYCLAVMVDMLSSVLSGANWGPFAPAFSLRNEIDIPTRNVGKGIGHFFGAMRIDGFIEPEDFKTQVDEYVRVFRATRPASGTDGPLIPGDPERRMPGAKPFAWLIVTLLTLIIAGGGIAWWAVAHRTRPTMYFSSPVPLAANDVATSPNGEVAALVAYSEQANKFVIWRYQIGARESTVVPGTEDASHPFWSPDGRTIAFFADGKLKRVDAVSGMSAQVLCDAPNGRGGAWNRDGVILFSPDVYQGIHRISASGGTPVEVTKLDASRSETSHRWPVFLPDQRHFLYLAANFSGEFDKDAIFMGSLDSNEKRMVVSASSNAAYAEPGYLVYLRNNSLVAQHFDVGKYELSGEPRTIIDGVQYFPTTDLALFAVGPNGTMVVQTGNGADKSELQWIGRSGKQMGTVGAPGLYGNTNLSPDGRRVAYDELESDGRHVDIWVRELASDATTRLTFGPGLNQLAVWSPDGKQIVYSSIRSGAWALLTKNADGSGSDRPIADASRHLQGPWDWSRDGNLLMWKAAELYYVTSSDPMTPKAISKNGSIVRNAHFSADGKWIAYSSNENGNWEIYVSPFPRADSKWQVSREGGKEPRWRRDGRELFYLSPDGKMMAVPVKIDGSFEAGAPVVLFQTHLRQPISALDHVSYDVTADGQKFLLNSKSSFVNTAPVSVILNWISEMEK